MIMKSGIVSCRKLLMVSTIFFSLCQLVYGQDTILNKYKLWVIKDVKTYKATVRNDPHKQMADVHRFIPTIDLDLRYASTNNFMHKKLYPPITTTYLRVAALIELRKVQKELAEKGLGLKIFDAYRPYYVTEKMWEPIKDERYVADPKKGSGHNRGIAVDLTIINLKTKKELDMGTGFDNFTDSAHHVFKQLPEEVLQNRTLLKNTMEKYGFKALDSEWWHYFLPNVEDFELLDLSFKTLRRLYLHIY